MKKFSIILLIIIVFLLPLIIRVVYESRSDYLKARQFISEGNEEKAIVFLRRSAHWYAPASPYPRNSLNLLKETGDQAIKSNNRDLALTAFQSIRSSCLGTRSFYIPHKDFLNYANKKIAYLQSLEEPPPLEKNLTRVERERSYLLLLNNITEPSPIWSFLASIFFVFWIISTIMAIVRGINKNGYIIKRPIVIWLIASITFLGGWILFLYLA